jgi:hypothetical protein
MLRYHLHQTNQVTTFLSRLHRVARTHASEHRSAKGINEMIRAYEHTWEGGQMRQTHHHTSTKAINTNHTSLGAHENIGAHMSRSTQELRSLGA